MVEDQHADRDAARHRHGRAQALQGAGHVAALPCQHGAEPHDHEQRQHERQEGRVEIGRAHGDARAAERIEKQRIERAEQHGRRRDGEKQIIEDQRAFARDRREQSARLEQRRAQRIKKERAADRDRQQHQDEQAALGIVGEGMHRGQHARADQERAHQRQREGQDGEQDGPAFERVALLGDRRRMNQRGADEPGQERGVLDRVPEPKAAPAQFVIGPPAPERDADGQETPRRQRPGPHPARPGGIDAPFDQGRDGEGKGDREADIAEIEEGRMEGEAGVLQQRVEAFAVHGRREDSREGVGGEDDEQEKPRRDHALHG